MADVFLSYKSEDRAIVELLCAFLTDHGHAVWFDRGLSGDRPYHEQISEELAKAEVVVALWSAHSKGSRWVYSEADQADKAKKLINASLDGTLPPPPFDRLNATNLSGWAGDVGDPRLRQVLDDVQRIQQRSAGVTENERAPVSPTVSARAWNVIANSLNPDDYEAFLRHHQSSSHAPMARDHMALLAAWRQGEFPTVRSLREFLIRGLFPALEAEVNAQIPVVEAREKADAQRLEIEAAEKAEREAQAESARQAEEVKRRKAEERAANEEAERKLREEKEAAVQADLDAVVKAMQLAQADAESARAAFVALPDRELRLSAWRRAQMAKGAWHNNIRWLLPIATLLACSILWFDLWPNSRLMVFGIEPAWIRLAAVGAVVSVLAALVVWAGSVRRPRLSKASADATAVANAFQEALKRVLAKIVELRKIEDSRDMFAFLDGEQGDILRGLRGVAEIRPVGGVIEDDGVRPFLTPHLDGAEQGPHPVMVALERAKRAKGGGTEISGGERTGPVRGAIEADPGRPSLKMLKRELSDVESYLSAREGVRSAYFANLPRDLGVSFAGVIAASQALYWLVMRPFGFG